MIVAIEGELSVWAAEAFGTTLLEQTTGDMLDWQATRFPDHEAIVFPELDVRWTYAELRARVDRLATGLIGLGIGPGERVAVLAPNLPEWLLLDYALAKIGAVLVTVNTGYRQHELAYLLRQGRVAALFTVPAYRGNDYRDAVRAAQAAGLPLLRHVVEIGSDAFEALQHGEHALGAELTRRQAAVRPHDVVQIQYTSGTTGVPKGVTLTHRGTLNNAKLMGDRAGFDDRSRLLAVMPLFHTAGCVCNALGMLVQGGAFVGMAAFDAPAALALLGAERITVINAVPTMYLRLLAEPGVRDGAYRSASTLRIAFTGGTTIPPSMLAAMRDAFGAEPMVIMGMTEASPLITQTRPEDGFERNSTSAGVPLPFTELKIVGPDGEPVPLGKAGELCIWGYGVTPGYFDMPDRTAEAIDADGWLHSGDLATLAADGSLRIVGRTKDMVIRGGENLYPAEIENLLMLHPAVEQAQVVGVPDAEFGEEAFAFVMLRPGAVTDAAELRAFARASFSRHKVPRYIEVIDAFPQTASGKVKKFELREIASARVTA
ncbi:MAG: AMP-binding protein [Janthinobacterium lividum]